MGSFSRRGRRAVSSLLVVAVLAAAVFISALLGTSDAEAAVFVWKSSPGPTRNGASWSTAYQSIQQGINACPVGGEVWVAAGTYVENLSLKAGVKLYGGFAGNETLLTARNWTTNVTIVDGNQAGPVINVAEGSTRDNTRIDGFTIRNGRTGWGGGITCGYYQNISPTIANNIIENNVATTQGPGIYCQNNSNALITGNIIRNNRAEGGATAGGIAVYNSSPEIVGNSIEENTGGDGGGISAKGGSSPIIRGNTIRGNSVPPSNFASGGGIRLVDTRNAIVEGNTISGNRASWGGGIGVEVFSGDNASPPTIKNNKIIGNRAEYLAPDYWGGAGGGIYLQDASATVEGNYLDSNEAFLGGGGISVNRSPNLMIKGNQISRNTANVGGAVSLYGAGVFEVVGNTILGNSAAWGGGLCARGTVGSPIARNNLFVDNVASHRGSAAVAYDSSVLRLLGNTMVAIENSQQNLVFSEDSTTLIVNNILLGGTSGEIGYAGTEPVAHHNCLGSSRLPPGPTDVVGDPLLYLPGVPEPPVDPREGYAFDLDMHILPGSPCIDKGDDSVVLPGLTDMDGEPRIQGAHVDMGADEWDGQRFTVATPSFTPGGGAFQEPQTVDVTVESDTYYGLSIHYTTDGTDPDEGDPAVPNGGTIEITRSGTLKAKAYRQHWLPSAVGSALFTFQPAPQGFAPDGGAFDGPLDVRVTSASPGVTIRYTTDGSEPDEGDPAIENGGTVRLKRSARLAAKAFRDGWSPGETTVADFTLPPVQLQVCASGCQYPSIGAAVGAAEAGDIVNVAPGLYRENIALEGPAALTLRGAGGAGETVIDGDTDGDGVGNGSVISLRAAGAAQSLALEDLTLRGGYAGAAGGGGLRLEAGAGGSIDVAARRVALRGNSTGGAGGGILARAAGGSIGLELENTLVAGNRAGAGGGIALVARGAGSTVTARLVNDTVSGNEAVRHGGVSAVALDGGSVDATLTNDIVHGNAAAGFGGDISVRRDATSSVTVAARHSDLGSVYEAWGSEGCFVEGPGTFSVAPVFVNAPGGDYRLNADSPCIDAGDGALAPAQDIEGDPRPLGAGVDVGADERRAVAYDRLQLLALNGGEAIAGGRAIDVTWGAPAGMKRFSLAYSLDGGKSWVAIARKVRGRHVAWTPPAVKRVRGAKIRIVGYGADGRVVGRDVSGSRFTIVP